MVITVRLGQVNDAVININVICQEDLLATWAKTRENGQL